MINHRGLYLAGNYKENIGFKGFILNTILAEKFHDILDPIMPLPPRTESPLVFKLPEISFDEGFVLW